MKQALITFFLVLGSISQAQASQLVYPKLKLAGEELSAEKLCVTQNEIRTLQPVPVCVEYAADDGVGICLKSELKDLSAPRIQQVSKCTHTHDEDGVVVCDDWKKVSEDVTQNLTIETVEAVDMGDGAIYYKTVARQHFEIPACK